MCKQMTDVKFLLLEKNILEKKVHGDCTGCCVLI